MNKTLPRSSEILNTIAHAGKPDESICFETILQKLGERAFGVVLIFFALPSALPFSVIPGISLLFSLPIAICAFQMIIARKTLWLPKILRKQSIPQYKITELIRKTMPYLKKIERLLKPRWTWMSSAIMEVINGTMVLILAFLLMLPIPFSNIILASLIIVFSLGFVEKDGGFIAIGYIGSLLYLTLIYWVVFTTVHKIFLS